MRTCRYYKCVLHSKSARAVVRGALVAQIVHETLKPKTFYTIYYKQVKQMVTPIVLHELTGRASFMGTTNATALRNVVPMDLSVQGTVHVLL